MIDQYHGATEIIVHPDCSVGRDNLDFGKGYYLTSLPDQAGRWAVRMASDRGQRPIINVYEFDRDSVLSRFRCLVFASYDLDWLEFIVASRLGNQPWAEYDYIEGGIADDRVIDTVNLYTMGLMSSDVALRELSKHQPNNQVCILNQSLVDEFLEFKSSYVYE